MYATEDVEAVFGVGYFLDDDSDLGVNVLVGTHEVLAATDELLVLELFQRVETEAAHLLANPSPHHINIVTPTGPSKQGWYDNH